MNIELVDTRQQFDALEKAWTALYRQDPSANVFLSWRWLKQLFDRRAEPVCILAARSASDNQQYLAFLPLRSRLFIHKERQRFVRSYALAGNDWADQTGLLCAPEFEQEAIEALITALSDMCWQSLSFSDMSMSEDRYRALTAMFSRLDYSVHERYQTDNDGQTRLDVAPCIALPDSHEQYLAGLSANTRQRLRRMVRVLDSSDELRIEFSAAADHEQDLTAFVHLWRTQWRDRKGARTDLLADKYRRILQQGLDDGNLALLVLYQADTPVGMIACYLDKASETVSFFVSARDLQFDALAGGLLLHSRMIEWAIANHYRHYHLLRGDEPYKYSLGGVDQPVYSIKVRRSADVEKTRFLSEDCRTEALQKLLQYRERLGTRQTHRLYAQLLESWPNDAQTLTQYAQWLKQIGEHQHANSIEASLCAADIASGLPEASLRHSECRIP
ncbi:GNAT family N-acetyltransferase [Granulosicoccus sp. 3-233]|uniref:GNAT family N-acetyltransferase n=1 Tax=Granulosicoccus sp. 3-233 TaxID=3417969 RepID=UPI003D34A647